MKKILLVDGHSMINRAFYGVPPLTNSKGVHTNAVFGFFNIMFSAMDDEQPESVLVAFDLKAPTFRHRMYEAYKGTRKPMPPELKEQVPIVQELLGAMGIPVVTKEGIEADDILGTMAAKAEKQGYEVCILSGDRDLLQLATEHTKIRMPHTKGGKTTTEDFYAKDVLEKYQVTPAGIIELKALMGDASDNIPGVPKVGEKTATSLVVTYGTIENLKEHLQEITKNAIRQTLTDHFDLAELSKKLATIDTGASLDFEPADGKLGDIYTPQAYALLKELEFKAFLSRFDNGAIAASAKKVGCEVVDCGEKYAEAAKKIKESKEVFFVLGGKDRQAAGAYVCIPGEDVFDIKPEAGYVTLLLKELLVSGEVRVITYDLKRQLKYMDEELSYRPGIYDVMIMEYLRNPLRSDYQKDYPESSADAAEKYAGFSQLLSDIADSGMESLLNEVEMPLVFTLYRMEEAGVLVRRDALDAYGESLTGRIKELEDAIHSAAGEDFNINSPKQLGVILFEKMGLKGGKKTKTGYSTAADVLEKLAVDIPFVADILEYRALTKLYSTYVVGLGECIAGDGRIHTSFNQTVTATGRLSSSDPNLQNIPIRTKLGRELRKVFVPAEGYVFVDADYSQIELRILAAMSGDEKLIEAYGKGEDIHALTASQVFHVPLEEVTDQMRRNAKAVNFGIVYGISSFGLSQDLSISQSEAKQYIEDYYATYPGIESFLKGLVSGAKEKGYVTTLYGRRRPVPEISAGNFMQRQFGERVAMNAPIQGTAADIMKIAMLRVEKALRELGLSARIVLQVHDEILVETKAEDAARVKEVVVKEMMGAADLAVPLIAQVEEGENWYEAH